MAAAHTAAKHGARNSSTKFTLRTAAVPAVAALALSFGAGTAHAQAKPGASRSAEISAYGGFTYAKPDFGQSNVNNTGGTIGVNYTRYFINFPVHPSLEVRGTYDTGDTITEKGVTVGFRGTYDFVEKYDFRDRLHPYVDVLGGIGTVRFNHYLGIAPDRGFLLEYGIGLNVDAYKHFQVMADFQLQNYNFGDEPQLKANGANFTLAPKVFTLGISYRVPARSRNLTADNR